MYTDTHMTYADTTQAHKHTQTHTDTQTDTYRLAHVHRHTHTQHRHTTTHTHNVTHVELIMMVHTFSLTECAQQHLICRVVQSLHTNHMQMSIIEVSICGRLHMDTSLILICIWLVCRLCTTLHTKCCGAAVCVLCTCIFIYH